MGGKGRVRALLTICDSSRYVRTARGRGENISVELIDDVDTLSKNIYRVISITRSMMANITDCDVQKRAILSSSYCLDHNSRFRIIDIFRKRIILHSNAFSRRKRAESYIKKIKLKNTPEGELISSLF